LENENESRGVLSNSKKKRKPIPPSIQLNVVSTKRESVFVRGNGGRVIHCEKYSTERRAGKKGPLSLRLEN